MTDTPAQKPTLWPVAVLIGTFIVALIVNQSNEASKPKDKTT